ncbi:MULTISPECIES: integrase [unclassified Bradyrhizobium]|uniref:integrase n=1 Tax=unclassified Bradyrhizobium TaxID=2631580 RepID=UPI001FF7939C|nr:MULTISPECIES: integrase [unclassified Bradyrhizobium]
MLNDTGLPKLKPGKKLYRRGDRDGMYVAVLPIRRSKQIRKSGDRTIKVVQ